MSEGEKPTGSTGRYVVHLAPVRDGSGRVVPSETWVCGLCEPHPIIQGRVAFFEHVETTHPDLIVDTATGRQIGARSGVVSHSDYPDRVVWYTQWRLHDGSRLADSYEIKPRVDDGPWHDG